MVFEKQAHLGRRAAYSGQLGNPGTGLVDRGWRMRSQMGFNTVLMHPQFGGLTTEAHPLESFNAPLLILMQIAHQGVAVYSRQPANVLVRHALALEPQHLHLLLHARMRMMKAFLMQRLFLCFAELDPDHVWHHR
jgi:hypothetical protein